MSASVVDRAELPGEPWPDETLAWRSNERRPYGSGPWDSEPDKVQWRAHGFACLIHRNRVGALCGYVGVPEGHELYQVDYDNAPEWLWEHTHGGLTYSDLCQDVEDESHGICHVDQVGEGEVWWLGFDCAHLGDEVPGMLSFHEEMLASLGDGGGVEPGVPRAYRDVPFVRAVCERMAEAIAGANDGG